MAGDEKDQTKIEQQPEADQPAQDTPHATLGSQLLWSKPLTGSLSADIAQTGENINVGVTQDLGGPGFLSAGLMNGNMVPDKLEDFVGNAASMTDPLYRPDRVAGNVLGLQYESPDLLNGDSQALKITATGGYSLSDGGGLAAGVRADYQNVSEKQTINAHLDVGHTPDGVQADAHVGIVRQVANGKGELSAGLHGRYSSEHDVQALAYGEYKHRIGTSASRDMEGGIENGGVNLRDAFVRASAGTDGASATAGVTWDVANKVSVETGVTVNDQDGVSSHVGVRIPFGQ